ncbi:hypothetical protein B0O99DRAFT_685301 [Bisporella sp. PMI_857]|nr:hypothetical protein B0O99DRAFT_685301 [Bisporella sp. PMI_857]
MHFSKLLSLAGTLAGLSLVTTALPAIDQSIQAATIDVVARSDATAEVPEAAQGFSAKITWYDPDVGLGSCGWQGHSYDHIVSLPFGVMGASQSNGNPNCGRQIIINANGRSIQVTAWDKCWGCKGTDIDISRSVWDALGLRDEIPANYERIRGLGQNIFPLSATFDATKRSMSSCLFIVTYIIASSYGALKFRLGSSDLERG